MLQTCAIKWLRFSATRKKTNSERFGLAFGVVEIGRTLLLLSVKALHTLLKSHQHYDNWRIKFQSHTTIRLQDNCDMSFRYQESGDAIWKRCKTAFKMSNAFMHNALNNVGQRKNRGKKSFSN